MHPSSASFCAHHCWHFRVINCQIDRRFLFLNTVSVRCFIFRRVLHRFIRFLPKLYRNLILNVPWYNILIFRPRYICQVHPSIFNMHLISLKHLISLFDAARVHAKHPLLRLGHLHLFISEVLLWVLDGKIKSLSYYHAELVSTSYIYDPFVDEKEISAGYILIFRIRCAEAAMLVVACDPKLIEFVSHHVMLKTNSQQIYPIRKSNRSRYRKILLIVIIVFHQRALSPSYDFSIVCEKQSVAFTTPNRNNLVLTVR